MTQPYRPRTSSAAAAVALCLMIVLFVACGGGEKVAPTTTAPAGFTVMSDAEHGLAVAVPSAWVRVPLSQNPAAFDKVANELRRANPKLASILSQARLLGQSAGTFMAVAPDGVANVNLTVDKPKEKTIEEIVAASMTGLKNFGAANLVQEPATLNGMPAVKLTFRLPVNTDKGDVPTDETQYYLLRDKKAYILTVAAAPRDVAAAIAASLRLR